MVKNFINLNIFLIAIIKLLKLASGMCWNLNFNNKLNPVLNN